MTITVEILKKTIEALGSKRAAPDPTNPVAPVTPVDTLFGQPLRPMDETTLTIIGSKQPLTVSEEVAKLESALSYLSPDVGRGNGSIFDSAGYPVPDYWLGVVWAIASLGWNVGKNIARKWSMQSARYDEDGFENAWNGYDASKSNAVGIGSLYKLAKLKGAIFPCAYAQHSDTKRSGLPARDRTVQSIETVPHSNSSAIDIDEPKQLPILTASGDEIVELFNQNHFVTNEGAHTFVFREAIDPELGHGILEKLTFPAFKSLHNQVVSIGGKPRRMADFWLNSPVRRTYVNGMAFIPSGNCPDHTYNLWRGFGIAPIPSDVDPILDYLLKVVAQNDATNYQYLINWLAVGVQYPARQGEVAVVLRGSKGIGKSTLGRLMLKIYGQHGMQITNSRHLVGNFNGHLQKTAFLFADEAFFAGDRIGENVLKGLVTERNITVEKKGVDAVTARNRLKILMCSNSDWVVPATADERRFFILDVSDERRGEVAYWQQLNHIIDNGGAAGFLHYLQQIDLSKFDVRKVPNTVGLDSQKLQSLGAIESAIYDALYQGSLGHREWQSDSTLEITSHELMELVNAYCRDRYRFRFDTPNQAVIGRKIKQLVGAERRQTRTWSGRAWGYKLPTLVEARKTFCQYMGLLDEPWGDEPISGC